jgi:oligo-1,6-glucosidase
LKTAWWQKAIFYQIYPQSFADSNGDGIGDFVGIQQHLDYLSELGINAVWLNPIYASPLVDNGYDISDYEAINPQYGTLADFDQLLDAMHQRHIKLVMDLVVNHTSDQHEWFQQSRQSKTNPYADYYIWRDPKPDGSAPNNWGSTSGGSAWTYEPQRNQYYLHLFAPAQPDLNWEHPALRQAIYMMMRYWLNKGIDGFRMDVINLLSKPAIFVDGVVSENTGFADFYPAVANGPKIHEFLHEMNQAVFAEFPDAVTVGEMPHVTPDDALKYTDPQRQELNMLFQFDQTYVDDGPEGKFSDIRFKLSDLRQSLNTWQVALQHTGWNALYFGNHDQPRVVSRFGDDGKYRRASATMLATILMGQKGTPFFLQGDELGMANPVWPLNAYQDLDTHNAIRLMRKRGLDDQQILQIVHLKSRDNARTPMQWSADVHAGFTKGKSWLAVNPDYPSCNVDLQAANPDSVLAYYRQLIALRKNDQVLITGDFVAHATHDSAVYCFERVLGERYELIIGSFVASPVRFLLPYQKGMDAPVLIHNYADLNWIDEATLELKPYEAMILDVSQLPDK